MSEKKSSCIFISSHLVRNNKKRYEIIDIDYDDLRYPAR